MHLDYPRPTPEAIEDIARFSTAILYEANGRAGALPHDIAPLRPGMRLCGPALTVDCAAGDNLMLHAAIALASPGDVIVLDTKGYREAGPFGHALAAASAARGIAGIVTDGCLREGERLAALGFPAFCRGLSAKSTTQNAPGTVGEPVLCAGVRVAPGDLVVGDEDGVVIVPRQQIPSTAAAAERIAVRQASEVARLAAGEPILDVLALWQVLGRLEEV
jgi:4-hydroxy-4-methyl-2-oxoglutarate aldolase